MSRGCRRHLLREGSADPDPGPGTVPGLCGGRCAPGRGAGKGPSVPWACSGRWKSLLFGIAFPLGARKMDDAAGNLKQALPNVCDSAQIHVEVHQKSSRSLIGALLTATCARFLSPSFCAPSRACRDPALPSLCSPGSFLTSVSS